MPPDKPTVGSLIIKKLDATISVAEESELNDWINAGPENKILADEFLRAENLQRGIAEHWIEERVWTKIVMAIGDKKIIPLKRVAWLRYTAAAVLVGLLAGAGYFYFNQSKTRENPHREISQSTNDVAPGGNKAILTLANGALVLLDSAHIGKIAEQKNSSIIKSDSGKLVYQTTNTKQEEIQFNVLSTPKGGQYRLQLPDGSEVWLNAASSIKYPTFFSGKERVVEITGEAYFEVVHNPKMPFKVKAGSEIIEDIGTAFNVNSYADEEAIGTTLITGAVKISTGQITRTLKPGEQEIFTLANGDAQVKADVDIEEVIAWKNGRFSFRSADIESIMRQAARWYGVEVQFDGKIKETFTGGISRNVRASELFKILEYSNKASFIIEGKKVIVKPK